MQFAWYRITIGVYSNGANRCFRIELMHVLLFG